jgi:hypothetical protein
MNRKMLFLLGIVFFIAAGANAGSFINSAGGGYWDVPGSWTANLNYPGSGDTIGLSGAGTITVTNNQQFGATSGSSASTWSLANSILALTNGAILTHNAKDTFTIGTGANYYLRGSGGGERFVNLGKVVHSTAWAGPLYLTNGVTFENQGTQSFASIISSVAIDATSTLFINDGTIVATARGYIGATAPGATFTTFDGATLKGVNIVITNAATEFGLGYYYPGGSANTLTGQVKIASLDIGTDASLSFANVNMTVSFPASVSVAGSLAIGRNLYSSANITTSKLILGTDTTWNFGQGVTHYAGTLDTSSHTLTLQGTNLFASGNGATLACDTTGRLINQGLLYIGPAAGAAYYGLTVTNRTGGVAFVNEGSMVIRCSDSGTYGGSGLTIASNTTFSNVSGGVFKTLAPPTGWPKLSVKGGDANTSVFDNQGTVQTISNTVEFLAVTIAQISGTTTVRFKTPVNRADYRCRHHEVVMDVEKTPAKWGFSRKA